MNSCLLPQIKKDVPFLIGLDITVMEREVVTKITIIPPHDHIGRSQHLIFTENITQKAFLKSVKSLITVIHVMIASLLLLETEVPVHSMVWSPIKHGDKEFGRWFFSLLDDLENTGATSGDSH